MSSRVPILFHLVEMSNNVLNAVRSLGISPNELSTCTHHPCTSIQRETHMCLKKYPQSKVYLAQMGMYEVVENLLYSLIIMLNIREYHR